MTHEEAMAALPSYALGAFDEDVDALEAHLSACGLCRTELARFLETTAALGGAVEAVEPPASLRAAVLAEGPARRVVPEGDSRGSRGFRAPRGPGGLRGLVQRFALSPAAAALAIVALGLAAWGVIERQHLRSAREELARSGRGLALLTSTETSVVRLEPIVSNGTRAHGHWYRRPGIDTQVLVIEFMPALPPNESYFGWLDSAHGAWRAAGRLHLDPHGYGRLILPGDDGAGVDSVMVTRQARSSAGPEGEVILRWPK